MRHLKESRERQIFELSRRTKHYSMAHYKNYPDPKINHEDWVKRLAKDFNI